VTRWATHPLDILQAINETSPQLIHFSGHGSEDDELILQGEDGQPKKVRLSAIVEVMMSAADVIRMVFFNVCFSEDEAKAVTKYVDAAIGMKTEIGDEAAIVFAAQFYSAVGFGKSLKVAFEQAKAALMLEGIAEENTPLLFVRQGVDPERLALVKA
jgi:predicted RNase H-like HicB family nuclease